MILFLSYTRISNRDLSCMLYLLSRRIPWWFEPLRHTHTYIFTSVYCEMIYKWWMMFGNTMLHWTEICTKIFFLVFSLLLLFKTIRIQRKKKKDRFFLALSFFFFFQVKIRDRIVCSLLFFIRCFFYIIILRIDFLLFDYVKYYTNIILPVCIYSFR